uniref:Transcriptional regulator n=1 Tax=Strongyloides stercoralis TaxID=6248 RepID=A0A0K0EM95_STRER
MFDMTDNQQVIMSLILHIIGINFGIWCWYLFPKNPYRNINRSATSIMVKLNDSSEYESLIPLNSLQKDISNNRYHG